MVVDDAPKSPPDAGAAEVAEGVVVDVVVLPPDEKVGFEAAVPVFEPPKRFEPVLVLAAVLFEAPKRPAPPVVPVVAPPPNKLVPVPEAGVLVAGADVPAAGVDPPEPNMPPPDVPVLPPPPNIDVPLAPPPPNKLPPVAGVELEFWAG